MSEIRVMEVIGGDAPNKEAKLTVSARWRNEFEAIYEPGFCGCGECPCIRGFGGTEQEAISDYWEKWEDKYEL